MATQLPPEVVGIVQAQTSVPSTDWWVRDLSHSYTWLRRHEIFWILEGVRTSLVVVKPDKEAPYCTNCDRTNVSLSRLIDKELGARPWDGVGLEQFCTILADFMEDPRLKVATPAFVEKQIQTSWLSGTEQDPRVFTQSARSPELDAHDDTWTVKFNVFTFSGGVDEWVVYGQSNPFVVVRKTVSTIHPDGTFSYPFEF